LVSLTCARAHFLAFSLLMMTSSLALAEADGGFLYR
jgi:hypothetical protein